MSESVIYHPTQEGRKRLCLIEIFCVPTHTHILHVRTCFLVYIDSCTVTHVAHAYLTQSVG